MQSPLAWSSSAEWKLDYQNPSRMSVEEIARRRADFDREKAKARALRENLELATPAAAAQDRL